MATTDVVKQMGKELEIEVKTPQGMVKISYQDVKNYICPDATDSEIMFFLQLCKQRQLNPWLKEAYLIKYDKTKPAQIVTGKDAFLNKTQSLPNYAGFKAGIAVKKRDKDEIIYREGSIVLPSDILIGGWCDVFEYGTTGEKVLKHHCEVALSEYNRKQSTWNTMEATMIRKVAIVHTHREAWSAELAGMITEDEIRPASLKEAAPTYNVEAELLSEIMGLAEKLQWTQAQLEMNLGTYKGKEPELRDMLKTMVIDREAKEQTIGTETPEEKKAGPIDGEGEQLPLGDTATKKETAEEKKRKGLVNDIKNIKEQMMEADFNEIKAKYPGKASDISLEDLKKLRDDLSRKLAEPSEVKR